MIFFLLKICDKYLNFGVRTLTDEHTHDYKTELFIFGVYIYSVLSHFILNAGLKRYQQARNDALEIELQRANEQLAEVSLK